LERFSIEQRRTPKVEEHKLGTDVENDTRQVGEFGAARNGHIH
jgi:hypothetical protein